MLIIQLQTKNCQYSMKCIYNTVELKLEINVFKQLEIHKVINTHVGC